MRIMPFASGLLSPCVCKAEEFEFSTEYFHILDIRQELNEQLKCLDMRLETEMAMIAELQDFFKRRAEVEMEYSKGLDRIVKQIMLRHKSEKQRREQWPMFSTYSCWQHLLQTTKRQSKDHQILADIYSNQMITRLGDIAENAQRIYKRCREIGYESHTELIKTLNELQSAMKTYHVYHNESKQAELKLKYIESQKLKVEQHASKGTASKKFKSFEKQTEKKQTKYAENKLKALKARNEYLLCIDAANSAIKKYFVDDLSDLIDCMDIGTHNSIARAMMMYLSTQENLKRSQQDCMDRMNKCITDLDQRVDKQHFLETNTAAFSLPKKFDFQSHKGDEVCQVSAQKAVQDDLLQRLHALSNRLQEIKLTNDEVWKSMETAEKTLMDMISVQDYCTTPLFMEEKVPVKSPQELSKKKADLQETESFYMDKFRDYLLNSNLLARLNSKHMTIQKALGNEGCRTSPGSRPPSLPPKPKKRRIGKAPIVGQPKLFGGSIEEYAEATGAEIPNIVRSCVRVINLYGMHQQGVFRVSGAQVEINDFKNSFEKGEDPLVDVCDSKDINSLAGVLKLYYRELREPLFPTQMFDELIAASRLENKECVERVKELIQTLPRAIFVNMRYLFSFLSHVTEYSDENMMDTYNLAICFGPTLLPIPSDRDLVQYHQSVNDLIKTIIVNQEEIFPNDGSGVLYEKCMTDATDGTLDNADNLSEEDETEGDDDPEMMEALAQYDFTGRTEREISFKKGDVLVVFKQVSDDWWEGAYQGSEGLIPDKYIKMRHRSTEDNRSIDSLDEKEERMFKRQSTESLPAKPYSVGSLSDDSLDKCASQPNISLKNSSSSSDDLSVPDINYQSGSSPSLSSIETSLDDDLDAKKVDISTEDLQQDIDQALAEVMSGLQSLEMQQKADNIPMKPKPPKPPSANPKHTPDLVLDLPVSAEPTSPKDSNAHLEPPPGVLSAAETFAMSNQCTMKKASSMPRSFSHATAFQSLETDSSGKPVKRSSSTNSTMKSKHRTTDPDLEKHKEKLESALQRSLQDPTSSPIWRKKTDVDRTPPQLKGVDTEPVWKRIQQQDQRRASPPHIVLPPFGETPPPPLKPKPKFRPPIMKKPARSPELMKKLQKVSETGD